MKFSIITPSFNQGRFIRDCIESVRAQTGVDWEHIVMDAGSTDDTISILKEYPHLKWVSEPDKGMSDGINKGWLKADGDWVMWLNTDDYLFPGALTTVTEFASKHPQADVVYGGWAFVAADKQVIKISEALPFDLPMLIHYGCYIGSTACFFRKSRTVDQGFLLNTNFRQAMDQEYYVRLGKAGKAFHPIPEILAGFRVHGDNTSMRHSTATDISGILARQRQLAEGAAIRRAYGHTVFKNEMAVAMMDAALWYWFRVKNVMRKLFTRVCRKRPTTHCCGF